jgi:transcriptional pleiotropic regulator of transition state genes
VEEIEDLIYKNNTGDVCFMMRTTSIVRFSDALGRVTFPKELRDMLEIKTDTPLAVFTGNNEIILKKYEPNCMFCGSFDDLYYFKEKNICKACADDLKELEKANSR